jgi:hypothetical protein
MLQPAVPTLIMRRIIGSPDRLAKPTAVAPNAVTLSA